MGLESWWSWDRIETVAFRKLNKPNLQDELASLFCRPGQGDDVVHQSIKQNRKEYRKARKYRWVAYAAKFFEHSGLRKDSNWTLTSKIGTHSVSLQATRERTTGSSAHPFLSPFAGVTMCYGLWLWLIRWFRSILLTTSLSILSNNSWTCNPQMEKWTCLKVTQIHIKSTICRICREELPPTNHKPFPFKACHTVTSHNELFALTTVDC